jgi:hypothetical protein
MQRVLGDDLPVRHTALVRGVELALGGVDSSGSSVDAVLGRVIGGRGGDAGAVVIAPPSSG